MGWTDKAKEAAARAVGWLLVAAFCALLLMVIALALRVIRWGFGW